MPERKPVYVLNGVLTQLQPGDTLPNGAALRLYNVRTRSVVNGTLATAFENGDSQGGVVLATGDLILIYNQTNQQENGLYTVNASGAPTRATGGQTGDSLLGAMVVVTEGTYAGRVYLCTGTAPATVGTNNIVFAEAAGVGVGLIDGSQVWVSPNYFYNLFVKVNALAAGGLKIAVASGLTADRTLTIDPGDANRTLTLGGDTTLNGGTHSGTNSGDIQPVIGCSLTNSANLSINNTTFTVLTFDTENYDSAAFHSTSSNTGRITIPAGKAGKYLFTCSINWAANATGIREAFFRKNGGAVNPADGALVCQQAAVGGNVTGMAFSAPIDMAVGDYIEVLVYQDSGGALNISGGVGYSPVLTATFLGT